MRVRVWLATPQGWSTFYQADDWPDWCAIQACDERITLYDAYRGGGQYAASESYSSRHGFTWERSAP
jgi:hypothetical protein